MIIINIYPKFSCEKFKNYKNNQDGGTLMLKKIKVIMLMLVLLSLISNIYAEKFKRYKLKSGKIEYKLSGNSKGRTITSWDDYGYKEVQITETITKVWGMTTEEMKTILIIGSDVFEWKADDDKIYKTENPVSEIWEENEYDEKDIEEFSKETMNALGYEKVEDEKFDGKECEVWKGLGGKVWIWKKYQLPLKTDVKILGIQIISEAVDIKLDKKVEKSLFKYPKDRTVVIVENDEEDGEIDPNAIKNAFNLSKESNDNKKSKKSKKLKEVEESEQSDGDFKKEITEIAKESAEEGVKEGAKEVTKEEAKKASKKATKKLLKSLFK